jgi:chemotaxis protein CheD
LKEIFIEPGYIYVTFEPRVLHTTVGSGVVIALFDRKRKVGGMNYYIRPARNFFKDTTPFYSTPSIVGMVNLLVGSGSKVEDLEAHIFGGAENPKAKGYQHGLAKENVKTGLRLLKMKNISVMGLDVGYTMGRNVAFNTNTGELALAKVNEIDNYYWYPPLLGNRDN